MELEQKKLNAYLQYTHKVKVSKIAKCFNRSERTIYNWISDMKVIYRYEEIKKEIKQVLLCGDFKKYINSLTYSDLCLIRRKFRLYGYNKANTIDSILKYFKSYSILGLYPDSLNYRIIKSAYYKKAKETHPDITKDNGNKFKEVRNAFEIIMNSYSKYINVGEII